MCAGRHTVDIFVNEVVSVAERIAQICPCGDAEGVGAVDEKRLRGAGLRNGLRIWGTAHSCENSLKNCPDRWENTGLMMMGQIGPARKCNTATVLQRALDPWI